jgi:hypothetical protein
LEDIPEAGVSLKIGEIPVEILQIQDRAVKIARIYTVGVQAALAPDLSVSAVSTSTQNNRNSR